MIRRPPRSTLSSSSAASDVYKRQKIDRSCVRMVVWVCHAAVSTGERLSFDGTEESAFQGHTRRRLLALRGQTARARDCPLSEHSGHCWILARDCLSANDPKRTFFKTKRRPTL